MNDERDYEEAREILDDLESSTFDKYEQFVDEGFDCEDILDLMDLEE